MTWDAAQMAVGESVLELMGEAVVWRRGAEGTEVPLVGRVRDAGEREVEDAQGKRRIREVRVHARSSELPEFSSGDIVTVRGEDFGIVREMYRNLAMCCVVAERVVVVRRGVRGLGARD